MSNMLPAGVKCKPDSTEEVISLPDHEPDVEEPPTKRAKIINLEGITMGEKLTDIEINFAQSLLKKQFPKLNGFASTLYQDKKLELTD